MRRYDLLNLLIAKRGYSRYLEIGVRDGDTFSRVRIAHKESVDPAWPATHAQTSDEFFKSLSPHVNYDLIFIDGLHLAPQVEKDVHNSLKHLSAGGAIVLHDCNPQTEDAQSDDYDGVKAWNGTVWKAWARIMRQEGQSLNMYVVDTDEGCGVIEAGITRCREAMRDWYQDSFEKMTFEYLQRNRKALLNLISVEDFLKL
jgi:hypothetical protein